MKAKAAINLDSFKAYDVRGRIPDEINEALAYDIGRAYAAFVKPQPISVCGARKAHISQLFCSAWTAASW